MIVRGNDPIAAGRKGDILAFARETPDDGRIVQIALVRVDGQKIRQNTWYDINLRTPRLVILSIYKRFNC